MQPVEIPHTFVQELSNEEGYALLVERHGWLTEAQIKRVWQLLGRKDQPPRKLQVVFNRDEAMQLWPPVSRH